MHPETLHVNKSCIIAQNRFPFIYCFAPLIGKADNGEYSSLCNYQFCQVFSPVKSLFCIFQDIQQNVLAMETLEYLDI